MRELRDDDPAALFFAACAQQSKADQSAFGMDPYLNWIDLRSSCAACLVAAMRRHRKRRQTQAFRCASASALAPRASAAPPAATLACPVALAIQSAQQAARNDRGREQKCSTRIIGRDRAMTIVPVSRRTFIKSAAVTAGLVLSPAIIGRAEAATMKLKCSSSLP